MRTVLLVAALAASGCAGPGGFQKLYPGMTSREVVEAMGQGPTRAHEFPDRSSAWYYGDDQCVLMREDKLVAKSTTRERTAVDTPIVSIRDTAKAVCAPEGYAIETRGEQRIDTPFGSFKGSLGSTKAPRKSTPPAESSETAPGADTQPDDAPY
ncbi:hypothetical protein [Myxococcus faecalis]|uniref:hypothetical protein n=1 Tax=Myxococcus faecalis TaxID=3115646 RepID=UPI003CECABC1